MTARNHWRMPRLTMLKPVAWSLPVKLAMLALRGYPLHRRAAAAHHGHPARYQVARQRTAAMLLRPFQVGNLISAHAKPLTKIACAYGQQWTVDLLWAWFGGDQPVWAYGGAQDLPQWVTGRMPGLCKRLHAMGGGGTLAAQRLLDLAWERIRADIGAAVASSMPSYRDRRLNELGPPVAAVVTAAATIGAASTRDAVTAHVRQQNDEATGLEMSALRAVAATPGNDADRHAGFDALASDCATRLRTRLARPQRQVGDWSVQLPAGGCACKLCGTLATFLNDKIQRTFEWPLAKDGRQHVHSRIDGAELPVTRLTRRQGRPYTLVLNKTYALFTREHEARVRDERDLAWLTGEWTSEPAIPDAR